MKTNIPGFENTQAMLDTFIDKYSPKARIKSLIKGKYSPSATLSREQGIQAYTNGDLLFIDGVYYDVDAMLADNELIEALAESGLTIKDLERR